MMQVLQDEKKALAIAKFGEGCTWKEVSQAIGVHFTTLWRWGKIDPVFWEACQRAGADADAEVEATTFSNAIDPDPAHNVLRMFWLKSRMPKTYMERQDFTSKGEKVGVTVVQLPVKELHADNQAECGPTDVIPGVDG